MAAGIQATLRRTRLRIERHLSTRHVARVVYGSIIVLALIVALQDHPPAAPAVLALTLSTAVAVAVAELYSDVLGTEVRTRRPVDRRSLTEIVHDAAAVGFGVAFPAVYFVLATVGAMKIDTALRISKWTGLGLIVFYAFCAGRLAGNGVVRSLVRAGCVGAVGAVLVAVKALLH
jgi:hypothetical protein